MVVPRATYRLQFNSDFTFRDAAGLVDYLADLGISHLYASPFLEARRGSRHGYDITDHNRLNPEIGNAEDLASLVAALRRRGMGLILDFVPNHMRIGSDNRWWVDVLQWGEASPYAAYFDIDWNAARPDLRGKVLLPILGDQYGATLETGEIALRFERETGSFAILYYEHRLPVSPFNVIDILRLVPGPGLDEAADDALGELIAAADRLAARRALGEAAAARPEAAALQAALKEAAAAHRSLAAALTAAAASFAGRPDDPASWQALHALIEAQAYRLAYWRVAADEINYRRFFNINELAGLRIELPELFDEVHRLVFQLIGNGSLDGLRIDHIDGLYDPRGYCQALQERAGALAGSPFYITVEKILARYETLPDWPVAGTTGYDFTNQLAGLFVDPRNERRLTRLHLRATGRTESFEEVLYASKMRIATVNLASETNVLAHRFHALALADRRTRDFTLNGMQDALREVLAAFPVYRTYVDADGPSPDDRRYVDWAVALAKRRSPAADTSIFDFIATVLLGELDGRRAERHAEVLGLAMRFQQLSGPVMAKGLEDTAFYRHVRLVALNEVGGDPRRFGVTPAAFHRMNEERLKRWPHAQLATATHDTKRGEDGRLRLALLSELPAEWRRRVGLWFRINRRWRGEIDGRPAPVGTDEYLFYQSAVGAWPLDLDAADAAAVRGFAERLAAYMLKAVREGKEQSSWGNPHADYEAALGRFIGAALDGARASAFLTDLGAFVARLARLGAINGLAQTALKLTCPGVPDVYQGTELWDFSLVDPDNRRPVDFARRRALLAGLPASEDETQPADLGDLAARWRDGREKLFLVRRLLGYRAGYPELFAVGGYRPLAAAGARADHLFAFAREAGGRRLIAAVPRLVAGLYAENGAADWGDTALVLPEGREWREAEWRDILTGRRHGPGDRLDATALFAGFPVAALAAG